MKLKIIEAMLVDISQDDANVIILEVDSHLILFPIPAITTIAFDNDVVTIFTSIKPFDFKCRDRAAAYSLASAISVLISDFYKIPDSTRKIGF